MDAAAIDDQVQKELDAISLSSFNSEEEADEEYVTLEYNDNADTFDTMQLFLEKSSERNKIAQDILKDAEDLLTMCDPVEQTESKDITQNIDEENHAVIEYHDNAIMLLPHPKTEAISKTTSEIEDENRVKLEELENRLQEEEKEYKIKLEEKRISDEENLHQWESREAKMQKNISVMLDKANYWEKEYDQLAHEELATKEQDLEKEFLQSQERIELIQEEQKRILQGLLKEKEELDRKRNESSAMLIQKMFRGYTVRKKHGQELKQRILRSKEKRKQERIAAIEKRQAEMRTAMQKEKEENQKKAKLEKVNKERSAATVVINKSQDQISTKKIPKGNNKVEKDLVREKMSPEKLDENGSVSKSCIKQNLTNSLTDATVLHQKDNKSDNITDDLPQMKTEKEETIIQSTIDMEKEVVSFAVVTGPDINSKAERSFLENDRLPKKDKQAELKHDTENLNKEVDDKHSSELQSDETTNEIVNEIVEKNELDSVVKNQKTQLVSLPVLKKTETSSTVEEISASLDSEATENEIYNESDSTQEYSNSPPSETVVSSSVMKCQDFSDDKSTSNDSLAIDTCVVSEGQFDSEGLNLSKSQRACLGENRVTNENNFEVKGKSLGENSIEDAVSTKSVNKPDGQFTTENDITPENHLKYTETDTVVPTKSVRNVTEHDHTETNIVPEHCSSEISTVTSDASTTTTNECPPADAITENFTTEKIVETLKNNGNETNANKEALKSNQSDLDRDIGKLASSIDGNGTKTSNTSFTCKETHKTVESLKNLNERNKEFVSASDSSSSSASPAVSDNHIPENRSHRSDHNTSTPYSDAIKTQRNSWLERIKSKVRKEWKSPSVSKRRRLIRISSAAKRLSPFSENEILDGAFFATDCRVDKKVTDVEKAKCILLRDIEGGRNLSSLSRCAHLSHLTVRNCDLVSVESLQSCPCLKYVDVSHNAVNMISCSGMKRLEVLDVSHNRLTSIHGLEGCDELLFLDLSHNNITKISGLEDAKKLLHMRLSNNQLINASGIRCENLLYLDVSENHLVNLNDFENCNLLFSLNASGNNLEKLGEDFLDNAVLLTKLDVSRNSLQSSGLKEDTFLPFLTEFNLAINRIASLSKNTDFSLISPFLSDMNLSKNLLQSAMNLRSLASCQCLHKVDLVDNPLVVDGGDDDDSRFLRMLPEVITKSDKNLENSVENSSLEVVFNIFCPLHNFGKIFVNLTDQSEEENVLNVVSKQLEKLQSEVKRCSTDVQRAMIRWKGRTEIGSDYSNTVHPPQILIDHASHLKKMFELAIFFRNIHESADMTYTSTSGTQNNVSKPSIKVKDTEKHLTVNNNTFMAKDVRERIPVTSDMNSSFECDNESQPFEKLVKSIEVYKGSSSAVRASTVYDQLLKRNVSDSVKETAATQIQAFWKGCRVRKKHQVIRSRKISAAIKIQATWKGYHTRRKIGDAMKLLKQAEPVVLETLKQDEFEDIDLDGFDFDEKTFDEQWAYKVSSFDKLYSLSDEIALDEVPVFQSQGKRENVKQDFQTPVNYENMGIAYSKPPLPPIPSRISTPLDTRLTLSELNSKEPSIADSSQTKRSSKQDVLSNEWGIKSSSTADLMMRRARRMKGGRKKIQTADEKLHRFQEKTSVFQNSELSVNRKHENPNKMEYFKAREQGYSLKNKVAAEEDEQKRQYTYEWLHSQVGSQYDPYHKTSPPRKVGNAQTTARSHSSGFLPAIPKSPSLVGIQDLEIVSVSSSSSYMNRSKQRLRDIARRHNPSYTGQ